jgi:hypothetical protein
VCRILKKQHKHGKLLISTPSSQKFVKNRLLGKPDLLKARTHDALAVVVKVRPLDEFGLLADLGEPLCLGVALISSCPVVPLVYTSVSSIHE